jgi:hypothetical protein
MARAIILLWALARYALFARVPGDFFIYFIPTLIRCPWVTDDGRSVTRPPVTVTHILWRVTHSLEPRFTHERIVDKEKDESHDYNPHYNYTLKILRTALAVTPPLSVVGS